MATSTGRSEVKAYMASLPAQIEKKLLRGAARAAAEVVADEARDRVISPEVRKAIKTRTSAEEGRVIAKVQVQMGGYNLPLWLEYGTDPHFISVDDSQRQGMSVRKVNDAHKAGSLVINGQFVGATVLHPGARPHPFLRPALDTKEAEAIAAAQNYINARVSPAGITGTGSEAGDA
jgi:hypothetical protein